MNSGIKISVCFFLFLYAFGVSCSQSYKDKKWNRGVTVIERRFIQFDPDSSKKPLFELKEKVWYSDSMAIEEVKYLNLVTTKGITTQDVLLLHYRFTDLRNKRISEYLNFSDTATIKNSYSYRDSAIQLSGGWNFLYERKWDYIGGINRLSDTTIDNVLYRRAIINRGTPDLPYTMECYFRCDVNTTIFSHDKAIDKIVGCPLVKIYHYSPTGKGLHFLSEIKYISTNFTDFEEKVFTTWAKASNTK